MDYYEKDAVFNIYTKVSSPSADNLEYYYCQTKNLQTEFLMGINAGNTSLGSANQLKPRGLTIKEDGKKTPKLVLGDLSYSNISFGGEQLSGYGLFCNNVYLNGSLTTMSSNGKTAGVNTTSGINGDINIVGDTSNIIFWAGADSVSSSDIQNAPFQVTENGYVRATQAKFSESVFAGGTIESACIKTSKIIGKGEEAALSVYGTTSGISFFPQEDAKEKTFTILATGLKRKDEYFIQLQEDVTEFYGNFNGELKTSSWKISEDSEGLKIFRKKALNNLFVPQVTFTDAQTEFKNTVKYTNDNIIMEYRPTSDGYDLYIN